MSALHLARRRVARVSEARRELALALSYEPEHKEAKRALEEHDTYVKKAEQ